MEKNEINQSDTFELDVNIARLEEMSSNFEQQIAQHLLIEELNAKRAEVFENVVFEGKKRFYIEDLTERDFFLENTTPYQLEYQGNIIEDSSWGGLLCKFSLLLLELFPTYNESIYSFQAPWTKSVIFSVEKKTNYKQLREGLYLNCNHTALHSCWLLQDLMDYFGVDKSSVHFLIHRPSGAEPKKVKEYIENRFRKDFIVFLKTKYNRTDEKAQKVLDIFDKYLNPLLMKISRSYPSFYLFDSTATLYNYIKRCKEEIRKNMRYDDKAKNVLNKYLDYLYEYYKS